MPVYEYKCRKCLNIFEVLKSLDRRNDKEKCPTCESYETERIISLFSKSFISCSPSSNSTS